VIDIGNICVCAAAIPSGKRFYVIRGSEARIEEGKPWAWREAIDLTIAEALIGAVSQIRRPAIPGKARVEEIVGLITGQ